jgi:hypothetical protein
MVDYQNQPRYGNPMLIVGREQECRRVFAVEQVQTPKTPLILQRKPRESIANDDSCGGQDVGGYCCGHKGESQLDSRAGAQS